MLPPDMLGAQAPGPAPAPGMGGDPIAALMGAMGGGGGEAPAGPPSITDGQPGACGDFTPEVTLTDPYDGETVVPGTLTIGPNVPAFTGDDEATYVAEVEALCSLTATAGTPHYSMTVPLGDVISTDPDAGTLVEPDAEVTYSLSLGEPPPGGGFYDFSDFGLTFH